MEALAKLASSTLKIPSLISLPMISFFLREFLERLDTFDIYYGGKAP